MASTRPRPTPTPAPRFDALDAVRGLAALSVVAFHAYKDIVKGAPGGAGFGGTLAYSFDWGVTIFFVLSGFLIYLPFAESMASGRERPSTGKYLWRRAIRILPAYWVALAVFGTLAHPDVLWTPAGVVRYFLLLQVFDYNTIYHVLAPAWTLAIELSFYVALPLVAVAVATVLRHVARIARPGGGWWHLGAIAGLTALGFLLARLVVAPGYVALGQDPQLSYFTLLELGPMFAAGMALAVIRVHRAEMAAVLAALPRRAVGVLSRDATWLSLAAAAYLAALLVEGRNVTPWQPTYLAVIAAAFLLVPLVLRPEGRLATSLGRARPLLWLGAISYGLYLWHWPIQELLMAHGWQVPHTWPGYLLAIGTVLAISLPLAWLSYRFVEQPLISWARGRDPLATIRAALGRSAPAAAAASDAAPSAVSARPGVSAATGERRFDRAA